MSAHTCGNCKRRFEVSERDFTPLSGVEMAICIKENLDPEKTMKIVCPFCDTPMLVQVEKRVPASSGATMNMGDRSYASVTSINEMASHVGRKERCVIKTTFGNLPTEINQSGVSPEGILGKGSVTQIMVKCAKCQSALNHNAISTLIMLQMFDQVAGMGPNMQALLSGDCPQCKNKDCYFIYDPIGFEALRSSPASAPEPKKKGIWPFKK